MAGGGQLDLFGAKEIAPHVEETDRALAARVPPFVRFGTSSWSFPGWSGIVWAGRPSEGELAKDGLAAYARHPLFRTVGLDRSHYGPLREEDVRRYAAQLDAARVRAPGLPPFRAVSKVWDEITTAVFPRHPRFGARAGQVNPTFLDPERFTSEVLAPYIHAGFGEHAGPFVFELTPIPAGAMDPRTLATKVERFLERLPEAGFRWAFELRTPELFGPRWLDALAANGAAHVFNAWTAMPRIGEQLARPRAMTTRFAVARLMLPRFTRYADRKAELAPFDRIAAPQPEMREDVVRLVREAVENGCDDVYVLVNNKAEGSAPLTVRALAHDVAVALGR